MFDLENNYNAKPLIGTPAVKKEIVRFYYVTSQVSHQISSTKYNIRSCYANVILLKWAS